MIVVAVLLALGAGRKYYNVRSELEDQRRAMGDAWVQVDAVLEKHATAVSGLVDGVKDALQTQPQIQQELETARTDLLSGKSPADKIQANTRLNTALAKLLLLTETTPKWKTHRGFIHLESELADAESHIALPRRKYNEALEHYNAQIQQFPENVVASIAGLGRNDAYFKTEPGGKPPIKAPF
jgi:LemA protein